MARLAVSVSALTSLEPAVRFVDGRTRPGLHLGGRGRGYRKGCLPSPGSPPMRVRFAGFMCRSIAAAAWASPAARRRTKKDQTVAAIHYRNRSDSFQSRHKAGAGNRRGGNGELQIEGARRGAGTRQEARADSASRSSAHFVDSQGVDPRSLNWKTSSPGKARDRSPAPKPCTKPAGDPLA
jgi:hypothetical protein